MGSSDATEPGKIGSRRVVILVSELLEQELGRRPILFLGIACLTARDHIAFDAPAAPGKWYDMIHSQGLRRKGALTVGTDAFGKAIAPPL